MSLRAECNEAWQSPVFKLHAGDCHVPAKETVAGPRNDNKIMPITSLTSFLNTSSFGDTNTYTRNQEELALTLDSAAHDLAHWQSLLSMSAGGLAFESAGLLATTFLSSTAPSLYALPFMARALTFSFSALADTAVTRWINSVGNSGAEEESFLDQLSSQGSVRWISLLAAGQCFAVMNLLQGLTTVVCAEKSKTQSGGLLSQMLMGLKCHASSGALSFGTGNILNGVEHRLRTRAKNINGRALLQPKAGAPLAHAAPLQDLTQTVLETLEKHTPPLVSVNTVNAHLSISRDPPSGRGLGVMASRGKGSDGEKLPPKWWVNPFPTLSPEAIETAKQERAERANQLRSKAIVSAPLPPLEDVSVSLKNGGSLTLARYKQILETASEEYRNLRHRTFKIVISLYPEGDIPVLARYMENYLLTLVDQFERALPRSQEAQLLMRSLRDRILGFSDSPSPLTSDPPPPTLPPRKFSLGPIPKKPLPPSTPREFKPIQMGTKRTQQLSFDRFEKVVLDSELLFPESFDPVHDKRKIHVYTEIIGETPERRGTSPARLIAWNSVSRWLKSFSKQVKGDFEKEERVKHLEEILRSGQRKVLSKKS